MVMTGKQKAFSALIMADGSGWGIGLATENEPGYLPVSRAQVAGLLPGEPWPTDVNRDAAEPQFRKLADKLNQAIWGITPIRGMFIVMSSMYPTSEHEHQIRRSKWDEDEAVASARKAKRETAS